MKKQFRAILMLLSLVFVLGIGVKLTTNTAEAALAYKGFTLYEPGQIVHRGDYYFKVTNNSYPYKIGVSKSKYGTYKTTPFEYSFFTNGTYAYYMKDSHILYKYSLSKGTSTRLKTFSLGSYQYDPPYFSISTVYNGKVYVTKSSFEQWRFWTYRYDTKTKTTKLVKSDASILARNGSYVIAQNSYRTDVSPYPITLYKLTSSGMTKIKKLTSYGHSGVAAGNYFYYVTYPHITYYSGGSYHDMTQARLMRINKDGSGSKTIKTFKSTSDVYILKITSTYCIYQKFDTDWNVKYYKYTYATDKTVRVNSY